MEGHWEEKRRFPRAAIDLRVETYEIVLPTDFQLVNISLGGMRFRTTKLLSPGQMVFINLSDNEVEKSELVKASVVRSEELNDGQGMIVAVRFLHGDQNVRDTINEWVGNTDMEPSLS